MLLLRITSLIILIALGLIACGQGKEPLQAGQPAFQLDREVATKQRVLVIGGTSGVGLETVKLALQRGHSVTAMARHPERVTLSHERLALVRGDVLVSGSVDEALANQDVVVIAVGMAPTRETVTLFSKGTENVLLAMKKHKLQRIIVVSGIGAGESRGHGGFAYDNIIQPLLLKTIYEDKDRAEKLVSRSNTQWTIVRPGFLDDAPGTAGYRIVQELAGITAGDIARADVAHFIVAAFEQAAYVQSAVLLSN